MRVPFVSRWLSRDREDRGTVLGDVPWWVRIFTDWGRPLTAVVVLVLCAPGERHLADLAGWHGWLGWGFAGLFSLYAGISAVVATVRPHGARGKVSAVLGAFLSLLLAMGAQPVSHLFVTGWLSADPRPPLLLVVIVSCTPPFILGHLLHLASSDPVPPARVPEDVPAAPVATVTRLRPRPPAPVTSSPAPHPAVPSVVPVLSLTKGQPLGQPNMSSRALSLLRNGVPEDKVKDKLRNEYTSPAGTVPKRNSINAAVRRAKDKLSSTS